MHHVPLSAPATKFRAIRAALALLVGLGVVAWTGDAAARANGIATAGCNGCHNEAGFDGSITLTPDGPLEIGKKTNFILTISESQMNAAGFYVTTGGVGTLSTPGSGARITGGELVHSRPATPTNRTVEVTFAWTAPAEAGATDFGIAAVSANADGTSTGDRSAQALFSYTWGCDALLLYRDIDGDGYGQDGYTITRCEPTDDWVQAGGDCNDLWNSIYPGAPEQANGKDDDCDGEIDEGFDSVLLYPDADGDGYGSSLATPFEGNTNTAGYAANAEDCDDSNPGVHPGVQEVCDGHDNNCDGNIDEGTYELCGVGSCARRIDVCDHACVPGPAYDEICNGRDDDCDGVIDEGDLCGNGEVCDLSCQSVDDVGAPAVDPDAASVQPDDVPADAAASADPEVSSTALGSSPSATSDAPATTAAASASNDGPLVAPSANAQTASVQPPTQASVERDAGGWSETTRALNSGIDTGVDDPADADADNPSSCACTVGRKQPAGQKHWLGLQLGVLALVVVRRRSSIRIDS